MIEGTHDLIETALKSVLVQLKDDDMLGYIVELIVDGVEERQESAKMVKKRKHARELTVYDFMAHSVEDTLLDAESTLQLHSEQDISTIIESINTHLYQSLHPKKEELNDMGYRPGAICLAIMPEDGEWHEAEVVHIDDLHTKKMVHLCFVEFGYQTSIETKDIVLEDELAIDCGPSSPVCEMCDRPVHLTEHHLIPRQVHARYLKKGYTRDFLNRCIDICRQCHNKIHHTADNRTLAEEYNTLDKLLEHPDIQKYVIYARKQKSRMKPKNH